jgi:CheY-like chemotaxis protein
MAKVLIVEDHPDQLEIRSLLVEQAGHQPLPAATPEAALAWLPEQPAAAVIDLSLPTQDDGLLLLRDLRERSPSTRLAVLTGQVSALRGMPEAGLVDAVLEKPCPSRVLLDTIARLVSGLLLLTLCLSAREFRFEAPAQGEVVARLELASPGSDFSVSQRAAAVARLTVEGAPSHHVLVFGERTEPVSVFLGPLPPGPHVLRIERDEQYSAPGSPLEIRSVKFSDSVSETVARAPVLFARAGTESTLSDLPLLIYAEQNPLTYTVVFSNEDGGHSTAGLLARWGRTTDIEYVYRVEGGREIIQSRNHEDVAYQGPYFGKHPQLVPVTQNNMVAPGEGVLRFQLAPVDLKLGPHSREVVMDQHPWTYAIAAKELIRENRLTPEIGDPRDYLYLEAKIENQQSRVAFKARLTTETAWRTSHRDDWKMSIERSGWVRAAIRLPAGTSPRQIAAFGFDCLPEKEGTKPDPPPACQVVELSPAFFLTPTYVPGRRFKLPN